VEYLKADSKEDVDDNYDYESYDLEDDPNALDFKNYNTS
jgi:hypothetical protein